MPPDELPLLTKDEITRRIRSAPPQADLETLAAANAHLRAAAVLVPLLPDQDHWSLLLTRRTEMVQSHKGQVSFPGGAADPGETIPEETALREAYEEIGLEAQDIEIIGRLSPRPTISNFLVTPVVAFLRGPFTLRLSAAEVSRVFTIPLEWLADISHWEERPRSAPGGYYEKVIYFQPYDDEVLWGASARITIDLLSALRLL